jgi:dUTP pyrophosphatase
MKVIVQGDAPKQATPYSVGYDLSASEDVHFWPFQFKWVPTGIHLAVPDNIQVEIRPRSSMGISQGWLIHYGTIDPDYFGEVKVGMMNLRPWPRK